MSPDSTSLRQRSKSSYDDEIAIKTMEAWNNPKDEAFEPTVVVSWDLQDLKFSVSIDQYLLQPYIRWAQTIVRTETDVLMLTHLLLYFTTSVPSALYLYYSFSWLHGILHLAMQGYFIGTYTLMMHQHIHMNGILNKKYAWFDMAFPYITDPLMGHTWNSYFYHHIKHHHVEANGPDDLSSTLRFQRDDLLSFLHYVGRFFFLIWFDLPRYFLRKRKRMMALKVAIFELGDYAAMCYLASLNPRATFFVFIAEFLAVRVGLMVGNWGQHALVDEVEPDSDFRSSITLIDVAVSQPHLLSP
jgi:phosphoinositide-3-kinase regulatory subunit 4